MIKFTLWLEKAATKPVWQDRLARRVKDADDLKKESYSKEAIILISRKINVKR